jgi:conjugative transposon TraM protein
MQLQMNSLKFLRQRKFMMILPLLILPFVILFFVALGGGTGSNPQTWNQGARGLNVRLPDAQFKKGKEKSKFLLYEEAGKDSEMLKEKMKNDPYYSLEHQNQELPDENHMDFQSFLNRHHIKSDTSLFRENKLFSGLPNANTDANEVKIMDKLAKLKDVLHQKTGTEGSVQTESDRQQVFHSKPNSEEFERLMSSLGNSRNHDPRMDQLNSMLDKVMAIQHPEIMQDSISRMLKENQQSAYAVTLNESSTEPATYGAVAENDKRGSIMINRFYDIGDEQPAEIEKDNAIEAEIPETQTLVSGSTIKLRLLNDIRIHGQLISKNQFIYGIASLSNERLKIQFSSIRSGNNILPISMEAYDLDGLAGIYIPGSMNRDIAKQSGDQTISSLGLTSLDPSIGAQAAGAGIQAAKTLLSRKVKLVKVTIKEGYRVLLKDSHQKQSF